MSGVSPMHCAFKHAVASAVVIATTTPTAASCFALLAQPAAFDGKRVRVTGFVELTFEGNALYLSRELFEAGLSDYAIWLDVEGVQIRDSTRVRRRYIVVEGQFDASNGGHLGAFPGALKAITRLERLR